ncbi:GTP pyrophosphokinase [Pasteurella testudinis DSM 23072]|uniref:GTP pyrophosphokinase n=1 Tax=Pasteurella testudinis DSM 23072 TaxID=1122938 RepID=A0A1W1UER1_9PAST|nr:GTP diphosphokinase [Pasteurella testudinis]SMB79550.1 GTP pyrophosphokinase [Pasteurella testudinis DSM 23072]SUB50725.1 GTP pyrophosphokinase [Pasteurella testudinis]
MVAIRASHLLTPAQFVVEDWSERLPLAPAVRQTLIETWHYNDAKLQNLETKERQYLLYAASEMVEVLSGLNMDQDSLLAAMLFPLVRRRVLNYEQIKEDFGNDIRKLVKGVVDMDGIRQLSASQSGSHLQVDNVRRMLLAMVDDFRCVVIKLAERVAFLREENNFISEPEKILAARECSNIYAPLANRLGIGQLKWELEDYCFRYLDPDNYRKIAKLLHEKRRDREAYIHDFVAVIERDLQAELPVAAQVYGRPKHIYSIWKKMQKKNLPFEQLFDIRAVRIIVDKLEDCYTALGIVHSHFKHIAAEFDDYVAHPKPNGYQSIHTVVLGEGGKAIEVQIRTQQMHDNAELGVAAHWKYKEGSTGGRAGYEQKITWLRQVLAWQHDLSQSGDVMEETRSKIFDDRIYVFTPQGDIVDLPVGSTPLDFAYTIHSEVGHRCVGAKVADKIVPFTYKLQMGDKVEILTQKNPNPSRDWLNPNTGFVTINRVRSKIQAWFKRQDREKNIPLGKELLEAEMAKLGLNYKQIEEYALPRHNLKQLEDLYAGIGNGDIRLNQLSNYLQGKLLRPTAEEVDEHILRQVENKQQHKASSNKGQIVIEGVGNLMHHIARCCQPIPGDHILGYITQGRGISIHRADCEQVLNLQEACPERVVEAIWGESYHTKFNLVIRVVANDRTGLLRDITTVLANEKVSVLRVSSKSDVKNMTATIDMEIELGNVSMLARILSSLLRINDVVEARRLSS